MQFDFTRGFLLLIAPLAPLALGSATSPSLAATLGSSKAEVKFNNFSHAPSDISILAETFANAVATDGLATAEANNDITVVDDPFSADNTSFSRTNGSGSVYSGLAQSQAAIIGYDFLVEAGQAFSFNFDAALNLATSIDDPQFEAANATGNISLSLYNSTDRNNWILLDSFTLTANVGTTANNDFLSYDAGKNFTLNPYATTFDTNFGGNRESARGSTRGLFSLAFDNLTSLTLVEVKTNQADISSNGSSVPAPEPVPEPSNVLASLLCILGLGYRITRKAFRATKL